MKGLRGEISRINKLNALRAATNGVRSLQTSVADSVTKVDESAISVQVHVKFKYILTGKKSEKERRVSRNSSRRQKPRAHIIDT